MLDVSGLHSGYGPIPVIRGVNFSLRPGEMLGVLGHNGAGKSTLLKTIVGLLPTTAGTIQHCGMGITHAPTYVRARRGIGYVPQGRQIFPTLTVRENLSISASRSKRPVDEVLSLFPRISRLLDRVGGTLSGGEQQLLALARCLCARPTVILLDEPTEGIQPSIIEEIIKILHDIHRQDKLTILLVEQNLECLTALSERIMVLKRGVFVDELAGDDVRDIDRLAEQLS